MKRTETIKRIVVFAVTLLNIIWIWTSLTTAVDVAGESRGRSFGPCFPAGLSRGTVPVKNPKVVFSLT